MVADSHKWSIGCLYKPNKEGHAPCPIMKISVNGASTIIGPASSLIFSYIISVHNE
jgi:hypothetical protein